MKDGMENAEIKLMRKRLAILMHLYSDDDCNEHETDLWNSKSSRHPRPPHYSSKTWEYTLEDSMANKWHSNDHWNQRDDKLASNYNTGLDNQNVPGFEHNWTRGNRNLGDGVSSWNNQSMNNTQVVKTKEKVKSRYGHIRKTSDGWWMCKTLGGIVLDRLFLTDDDAIAALKKWKLAHPNEVEVPRKTKKGSVRKTKDVVSDRNKAVKANPYRNISRPMVTKADSPFHLATDPLENQKSIHQQPEYSKRELFSSGLDETAAASIARPSSDKKQLDSKKPLKQISLNQRNKNVICPIEVTKQQSIRSEVEQAGSMSITSKSSNITPKLPNYDNWTKRRDSIVATSPLSNNNALTEITATRLLPYPRNLHSKSYSEDYEQGSIKPISNSKKQLLSQLESMRVTTDGCMRAISNSNKKVKQNPALIRDTPKRQISNGNRQVQKKLAGTRVTPYANEYVVRESSSREPIPYHCDQSRMIHHGQRRIHTSPPRWQRYPWHIHRPPPHMEYPNRPYNYPGYQANWCPRTTSLRRPMWTCHYSQEQSLYGNQGIFPPHYYHPLSHGHGSHYPHPRDTIHCLPSRCPTPDIVPFQVFEKENKHVPPHVAANPYFNYRPRIASPASADEQRDSDEEPEIAPAANAADSSSDECTDHEEGLISTHTSSPGTYN